ncbi:hypothetical protein TWF694_010080 [Orbilia ellipsospora]|uniref:1-alkyl-2-acetylglycerophosphocholine esterase n=1 Tax=Orbilia ellipsospora TaxID=2528407 RepID=A0AAV9X9A0_9PEZI
MPGKVFPWMKQGRREHTRHNPDARDTYPKSRPPKTRPAKSTRDVLLHSLPQYTGPYTVGIMELELPVSSPRSFGPMKRNGRHALTLETVLFNIYYPAALGTGRGKDPSGEYHTWSRATWLPRPRGLTAKGYAKFGNIPEPAMLAFFGLTAWWTKIPAYRNAKLAEHWPPSYSARRGGEKVKDTAGEGPDELPPGAKPAFPLLMFSHGLGGSRTVYSSVCGEFASYGFIVVATEHRDGSGSRSIVNYGPETSFLWEDVLPKDIPKTPASPANPNFWSADTEKAKRLGRKPSRAMTEAINNSLGGDPVDDSCHKRKFLHRHKRTYTVTASKRRRYRTVDYIWPKDNPYDTSPSNKIDSDLRTAQINMRKAELAEIYKAILALNSGNGDILAQMNLLKDGAAGASSRALDGVNWQDWEGRIQTRNVTVAGHSFGAASTIEVLRRPSDVFSQELDSLQGIIYDPWGAAIQESEGSHAQIKSPLLGINSEAFMHWADNFAMVMKVFEEASRNNENCWMMTVKGTVHISQSDFTVIYPRLCALLLKASVDPERAIDININASLEFLKRVMPPSVAKWNRVDDEGLLDVKVLGWEDEDRFERRPTESGIAKTLKAQKDLRSRVQPQLPSLVRRKWNRRRKGGMEDEIWMHLKPGAMEGLETGEPLRIVQGERSKEGSSLSGNFEEAMNPKENPQTRN